MDATPQRVLVVIPHPGDAEYWCAGSIARWLGAGAQVRYVLCTDGGKSSTAPASAAELGALREQEQAAAAQALGVQELVLLHREDGFLEDEADFRKELVRQIRQLRPEAVLCPEPYRKNLAWHRDNRIAGQVALDAVFPCARDHLHFEELWRDEGLEPHNTPTILFWGTEQPDVFVDIAGDLDAKSRALQLHASQLQGQSAEEIAGHLCQRARQDAGDSGLEFGEAFRKVSFRV